MVIFVGALPSNLSPSPTIYNSSLEVTPVVYVLSGTVLLFFLVNHSKIQRYDTNIIRSTFHTERQ